MRILYMAAFCPESQYSYLTRNNAQEISIAAHKFNKLLSEGLSAHDEVSVSCIVSNIIHAKLEANLSELDYRSDKYVYLKLCRGKLRNLDFLFQLLKYIRRILKDEKNTILLCDALNRTFSIACIFAKWIYKVKAVAIITDLPQYVGSPQRNMKQKLMDKLGIWYMNKFSAYVLLTEPMNRYVNKRGRPYCVVEGFCDARARGSQNSLAQKYEKLVCIYAGSIHKQYHIAELVQAFNALDLKNCELHLYGKGNFYKDIIPLCDKSYNVHYLGIVPNHEILEAEKKAILLINPRPTDDDYTKYSFPSKIMEYMASGTPLLTTKLPGMPEEYYPYVFLIEDESVEGMTRVLRNLLNKPAEELHAKGMTAKEFVLSKKSNIVQAQKIYAFLLSL